jgi:hypothetical protein
MLGNKAEEEEEELMFNKMWFCLTYVNGFLISSSFRLRF